MNNLFRETSLLRFISIVYQRYCYPYSIFFVDSPTAEARIVPLKGSGVLENFVPIAMLLQYDSETARRMRGVRKPKNETSRKCDVEIRILYQSNLPTVLGLNTTLPTVTTRQHSLVQIQPVISSLFISISSRPTRNIDNRRSTRKLIIALESGTTFSGIAY